MLTLAAEETKNGPRSRAASRRRHRAGYSLYVERYRPLLADQPLHCCSLAPSPVATRPSMRCARRSTTLRRITAAWNSHRTISVRSAAISCCAKDRGAHGKVQRILGHKNLQTTLAHYSGLEAALAVADYGSLIEDLRAGNSTRSTRPSRSRPKARAIPAEDAQDLRRAREKIAPTRRRTA